LRIDFPDDDTMLVHLPRKDSWGDKPPVKNGLGLGGYGAESMQDALINGIQKLPDELCRSLTWGRGKELSAHTEFTVNTGIPVFFADPHSHWQRGTNENTNGVLRQYFPKGTDLS
jgi:IS30 family transposase